MERQEFTIGQVHEALIRLRGVGLTPEGLQRLIESNELAKQIMAILGSEKPDCTEVIEGRIVRVKTSCYKIASEVGTYTDYEIDHPIVKRIQVLGMPPFKVGEKIRVYVNLKEKKGWFKKRTIKRTLREREHSDSVETIELLNDQGGVVLSYESTIY